jgi:hypothetical protein
MADATCGAKTRAGGKCRKAPISGKKRCRLHGGLSTGAKRQNTAANAVKHGFYSDALRPDERVLWARVQIGSVDDEIRLMKIKLHRLVKLSGNAEVAALVDAAIEVTRKQGDEFDHELKQTVPYDKIELKAKAARYGDLIIQALDEIRKLELARLQMALGQKELDKDDPAANAVDGFEIVEYE